MSDQQDLPYPEATDPRPNDRVRTACLVLIAVCVVGAALWAMKAILAPLLIALFLFFLLRRPPTPSPAGACRRGFPIRS